MKCKEYLPCMFSSDCDEQNSMNEENPAGQVLHYVKQMLHIWHTSSEHLDHVCWEKEGGVAGKTSLGNGSGR